MIQEKVSKDILLDGAQMSLSGFIAGTLGFLKERNISARDWIAYIGEKFADSWADLQGRGADEVMQHLLNLEILPLGVGVVSSQLTPQKAEVVLTSLPSHALLEKFGTNPREFLKGFGVTQKEYEIIYAMFEPAAETIGMRFSHHLREGKQVITLEPVKG